MSTTKVHDNQKLSFEGIDIFTGLDVHKKSWKVTPRLGERAQKTFSMDPSAKTLNDYLVKNYPGANYHTVYEAGCFGFHIHRELTKLGINNIIVHAADIPTSDKDRRQKTDTRDSKKLAAELEKGELTAIHVPTEKEEYYRGVFRRRAQIKKTRRSTMVQIRSYFTLQGIELPDECWSKKHVAFLKEKASKSKKGFVVLSLIKSYEQDTAHIKEVSVEIDRLTKERGKEDERKILETAPGIARTTSETLLAEMIHPSRFGTDNQLCSYFGLMPATASSGEKEVSRGITTRRRGSLRHVIIESAWTASKSDPELALAFTKLCARMKRNEAIIRIARKLLLRIKRIWLNMEPYRKNVNIEPVIQT